MSDRVRILTAWAGGALFLGCFAVGGMASGIVADLVLPLIVVWVLGGLAAVALDLFRKKPEPAGEDEPPAAPRPRRR